MRHIFLLLVILLQVKILNCQILPGFEYSSQFDEQQLYLEDSPPGTRILINAPGFGFGARTKVLLVFYALPNGNTIEQTFGKNLGEGDDWHYNIQHIGAQTRFLRTTIPDQAIVVVYLQAVQRSWSKWLSDTPDSLVVLKSVVENIKDLFKDWDTRIVLNSHSGGGRFIFSYIDAVREIPREIKRIALLDSNYGYEDTLSGTKLTKWLKSGKDKYLCTLAYNDSAVIYNGSPPVSPTGGTWYRSKMMKHYLASSFRFKEINKDTIIWNFALRKRIEIVLRTNPDNRVYHTRQVELNGFIHSILSGTKFENRKYTYFGERAYSDLISDSINIPLPQSLVQLYGGSTDQHH